MLKDFVPRLYQETIFNTCTQYNTLVVLPTGLGKTNVFLMATAFRLQQHPESKVLLLGPTRPLIKQYYDVFLKHLHITAAEMAIFTGHVKPETREELWKKARIIFSTPQGLENDIINKRISFEYVSLLGIDEAHRAVGNYSYVWLAKQYLEKATYPRLVAMTASPGADLEHIQEVCTNLGIEEVEVRTDHDSDVQPYIQEVKVQWQEVYLPDEIVQLRKCFQLACAQKAEEIKKLGFAPAVPLEKASRRDLLGFQGQLHAELGQGDRSPELLKAVSLMAEIMKLQHALELTETQGVATLAKYLKNLEEEAKTTKVKATQNVVVDSYFRMAVAKCDVLLSQEKEHPKREELKRLVSEGVAANPAGKFIIFSQYRDSVTQIVHELNKLPAVKAKAFVGQANRKENGLSQKEQLVLLDEFRQGAFNVLVSSSVGEEGLDIPAVDTVIFYEPVPSAIRHIQRRGRTARHDKGNVIVLVTKNTRDEAYRWSAVHKERRMHRLLGELRGKLKTGRPVQQTLLCDERPMKVYADFREKGTGIIKELLALGADVRLEQLDVGDYIASSRVGIEYKSVGDFVQSIIDGRLLPQLRGLKDTFERPLVIIEGAEDIYTVRNMHPHAIQGMLATIAVSFGIPMLFTRTNKETAQIIATIARREQEENNAPPSLHAKKPLSIPELQEYVVSALPGVGSGLAKPLLQEFRTIKNLVNAPEEQLIKVHNIGSTKAKGIREILDMEYNEESFIQK
ncbi:DEAD/DEAH box helicase [Candidatus Woesearchaeota archaeon]|nr:DEAD/DEAH box helicase [Candidatus Woesearchaeota archaeon]